MGEKTEKASPKKLRDARKKGQVAKSQDLPSAFTFIVSVSCVLALSATLYKQLSGFLVGAFSSVNTPDLPNVLLILMFKSIEVIFMTSIPILVIVAFIGVLVNFLAVGPVFSTEVFKFDPKKFNPISNLKAKFKVKTLVELLKSHVKVFLAAYIIYLVMYKSIPVLIQTVSLPISGALLIFHSFLMEVIIKVGLFFIVIAVADFAYQKKSFANEMKMEKFEVKQEYKNTEGDPHIKGKRKQIAQEIAYSDGPSGGVKKAQAVITNPTHIAVAIAYVREVDPAPYIVAMGTDMMAERIIKAAAQYDVPVLRNIPLAHKLLDDGEEYTYVPEETYGAIAEVLRWVESLKE